MLLRLRACIFSTLTALMSSIPGGERSVPSSLRDLACNASLWSSVCELADEIGVDFIQVTRLRPMPSCTLLWARIKSFVLWPMAMPTRAASITTKAARHRSWHFILIQQDATGPPRRGPARCERPYVCELFLGAIFGAAATL